MNRIVLTGSLLAVVFAGCGEGNPRETSSTALDFSGELPAGVRRVRGDGASASDFLVIENAGSGGQSFRLALIERPRITHPMHAIIGEVRYEGVAGYAYLMMVTYFSDRDPSISKGYLSSDLGEITGDSAWRSFQRWSPSTDQGFDDAGSHPTKIELLLEMPGSGTVYLRNTRLVRIPFDVRSLRARRGLSPLGVPGEWWTGSQAGWIGGIGGSVIGCLGGLIGCLAGMGRGRRFVIAAMIGMIVAGVASLVLGVVALGCSQPYSVYYPLLLVGVILIPVSAFQLPMVRRRYAEMELRKMSADDVG